jgi:hypothetical protein
MSDGKHDDGVSAITAIIAALKPLDEKTRKNVLSYVLAQLGLNAAASFPAEMTPEENEPAFRMMPGPSRSAAFFAQQDIRSLAEEKSPRTVNEKVALIAFYLKNLAPQDERKDQISAEDIDTYFPQADFELPQAPGMALTHAKNAGYLHALGNGQFRLNPVGHNLITHKLPLQEGAAKPRRRKTSVKKRL